MNTGQGTAPARTGLSVDASGRSIGEDRSRHDARACPSVMVFERACDSRRPGGPVAGGETLQRDLFPRRADGETPRGADEPRPTTRFEPPSPPHGSNRSRPAARPKSVGRPSPSSGSLGLPRGSGVVADVRTGPTPRPDRSHDSPDTLASQPDTLSSQPDTLSSQPDTLSSRPDTLSSRPDTLSSRGRCLEPVGGQGNSRRTTSPETPSTVTETTTTSPAPSTYV